MACGGVNAFDNQRDFRHASDSHSNETRIRVIRCALSAAAIRRIWVRNSRRMCRAIVRSRDNNLRRW